MGDKFAKRILTSNPGSPARSSLSENLTWRVYLLIVGHFVDNKLGAQVIWRNGSGRIRLRDECLLVTEVRSSHIAATKGEIMSPSAIVDLETELETITELNSWAPSFDAVDFSELSVERRDVLAIKSDFATMGGQRPRQMD